jgi:hypothetical protein
MKGLLVLLVLAGALYVGYTKFHGPGAGIGIGAAAPLGTAQGLDRHLVSLGLEKQPASRQSIAPLGLEATATEYLDRSMIGKTGGFKESVVVFVDDKGAVRALAGMYILPADTQGMRTTPVSNFLTTYWNQVGGGTPHFAPRTVGSQAKVYGQAIFARQQLAATFSKSPVEGEWVKEEPMGNLVFYIK